ncbi:MAG: hypothetical protein RR795_08875 [Cetobacterium sp.]|uniref:hypothetical protein n=1 Tax=Cetobacterium sp. TaxID=2071632 RepID=UPI002FC994A7
MDKKKIYKLTVRLNEDEYRMLLLQSEFLEVNKNEFFREMIRKGMYMDIKKTNEYIKELLKTKRSISNSLNQIAKKLNVANKYVINFKEFEKELEELWLSLNQ